MSAVDRHDFLIVGAGIVGLAIARELHLRHPDARIAVLEKEDRPGRHASGRNSGVLHSGLYYGADTLKARVCARGAALMRAFAAEHCVPCQPVGKVILAADESDLPGLDRLETNARANGIPVERLDEAGVRAMEPHATPFRSGLYSPSTSIIDAPAVLAKLHERLAAEGVLILTDHGVEAIDVARRTVRTTRGEVGFGFLVNAAGAHADRIAAHFAAGRGYALVPFKGIYFALREDRRHLVRGNLYPVPDPEMPFLGVHLTRATSGHVYVGPTAIPAFGREHYGVLEGLDLAEGMRIAGRLAAMYAVEGQFRKYAHGEAIRFLKPHFLCAARRLVGELTATDLVACGKVGIRPQLVDLAHKRLVMDFLVENAEASLHVLNAISPAFTGAFAFAELVADRVAVPASPVLV